MAKKNVKSQLEEKLKDIDSLESYAKRWIPDKRTRCKNDPDSCAEDLSYASCNQIKDEQVKAACNCAVRREFKPKQFEKEGNYPSSDYDCWNTYLDKDKIQKDINDLGDLDDIHKTLKKQNDTKSMKENRDYKRSVEKKLKEKYKLNKK